MPPDFPTCGYDGALCDYTIYFIISGAIPLITSLIIAGYAFYRIQ